MEDTKLTLSIKKRVVNNAKIYAKKQGRSLSDIVENYLMAISGNEILNEEEIINQVSPRIRALAGIAKKVPADIDEKELITEYLTNKYLK